LARGRPGAAAAAERGDPGDRARHEPGGQGAARAGRKRRRGLPGRTARDRPGLGGPGRLRPAPTLVTAVPGLPGFPTGAEVARRWAERTGLALDDLDWYRAFAHFKFAVITHGINVRVRAGAMGGQEFGDLTTAVAGIAEAGLALAVTSA
jgi:hypothetical protein